MGKIIKKYISLILIVLISINSVSGVLSKIYTEESKIKSENILKNNTNFDKNLIIGSDHPKNPGEVMIFKEAKEIPDKVNTWEVTLRVEAKDKLKTSDVVLVIDTSGSMRDNGRMESAKNAAKQFIDNLLHSDNQTTKIAIVSFSSEAKEEITLTTDKEALKNTVDRLNAEGGTFTQSGLKKGEEILKNSDADDKSIVLLSDGEPTFSYKINNPNNYLSSYYIGNYSFGVNGYIRTLNGYGNATNLNVPEQEYDYSGKVGEGTAMFHGYEFNYSYNYLGYYINYNSPIALYHHGNSAINQAGFSKNKGVSVFSVALEAGVEGEKVLKQIADEERYYKADPQSLQGIFNEISGVISSGVKDANIEDEMGVGFEITKENIDKINSSQGEASYNDGKLFWKLGTLSKSIEENSDIKYAELKYIVEINDDILKQIPDENGRYVANRIAKIKYKDLDNKEQLKEFPIPKVKPVLYKVEKVLLNKNGEEINKDKNFNIKIKSYKEDIEIPFREIELNTKNGKVNTGLKTDLRNTGYYSFREELNSTDDGLYNVEYYLNGIKVEDTKFNIIDGNTGDINIKVVNKEKQLLEPLIPPTRDVKVRKEWKDKDGGILEAPVKEILVQLYKDGVKEGEAQKLSKENSWEYTFKNLKDYEKVGKEIKKYTYTIKEVNAGKEVETEASIEIDGKWYKVTYEGDAQKEFVIKNKKLPPVKPMIPPTRDIKVIKEWKDHNGKTITAPTDKITVELYKDGEATGNKLELTKDNNWTAAFKKLPVSETLGGINHEYTVKEVGEEGNVIKFDGKKYKVVYGGSMKEGFTVTNEKEEPPTPPSVEKPKIPPTPKSKLPKTGYGSNASIYTMMTILSTVVLIALGNKKKKKRELDC